MTGAGSSEFEDRLRASCRAAQREHPEWRRQAGNIVRSAFWRRVKLTGSWLMLVAFSSAIGFGVGRKGNEWQLSEAAIGLSLASVCLTLYLIGRSSFTRVCHADYDQYAYALMPVTNHWIVRRQFGKWVFFMSPMVLVCIAGLLAAGSPVAAGWRLWAGALSGGVALCLVLGALAVCAAHRPWLQWLLLPINVLGWTGLFVLRSLDWFSSNVVPVLNEHGDQLAWLVPTAWVIRPVQEFFQGGPYLSLPLLLSAVALVWFAGWEMRLLIARLRPREEVLFRYAAQLPEDVSAEVEAEFHRELDRPPDADEEEASGLLRSRGFLQPRPPSQDWITRLVWSWWSPRQRLLAEWANSDWPRWSRRWLWGAGWMLLGLLSGWLTRPVFPNGWLVVWLLPTVVSLMLLLPCRMAWQRWAQNAFIGSGVTPWINLMPVTVPELVRMDRKLALVRWVMAIPVALLGALGLASLAGIEIHEALTGALLTTILSLGIRPVMLAMHLSNKQSRKPLGVQFADLLMLGMTLVAAGLALTSFIGVIVSGPHKLLMLVPAVLALLVCDLIGRWSIRLWSRRRLSAVSPGQE